MRMQPCEARVPIVQGSPVPWMPTPPVMPSQRALSGFSADPPGTTSLRYAPAQGWSGADQAGLTALLVIEKRPDGVGYAGMPTATPKVLRHLRRLNSRSLKPLLLMVSTVGYCALRSRLRTSGCTF